MSLSRVGVYVCHCGTNIAANVDVARLAEFARSLPGAVLARDYPYMCSDRGQALIREDVSEQALDRVVVAACSPRMHEPTFRDAVRQAGLNPYMVEMANIREQCAWVHDDRARATEKATRLVASAVARAVLLEPLEERQVDVEPGVVVIGGGIAGLAATLTVAEAGYSAYLVERSGSLGGRVRELDRTYPTLDKVQVVLRELVSRVAAHPNVTILLRSSVTSVDGCVGDFTVEVKTRGANLGEGVDASRDSQTLVVGSVIVATGFDPFDPRRKPELGYGQYPSVITTLELEQRLAAGDLGDNGAAPRRVAFLQCVGSRDVQVGNPYCSRVCCMVVAKQARQLRGLLPDAEITVYYSDVRTFGKGAEEFYDETRAQGVLYRRASVSEIVRSQNRVRLVGEDTLLSRAIGVEVDLVVLATGMEAGADSASLSAMLRLQRSPDGFFLEAHPKLRPVDTATAGVYLAGCCQGPKGIADTIAHAKAAASSALIPLLRGSVQADAATAIVNPALCANCGLCVEECPYGAPALDPFRGVATVNALLCQGCGACAVVCPAKAISLQHATACQVLAQVDALMA